MSNNRLLLNVLAICIIVVVVLNISYLPKILRTSFDASTGNLRIEFLNENDQSSIGSPMQQIKKWSERRDETQKKKQQLILKQERTNEMTPFTNANRPRTFDPFKDVTTKTAGAIEHPPEGKLAGLHCEQFGGPSDEIAAEMVYWRDIPSDSQFHSPYASYGSNPKYLTFEPDEGGWNNIRMSMETATTLAHAMGRILVLPPEQDIYLLNKDRGRNNRFTFHKFFPFDAISEEHPAVEVISMEEFLKREVMTGQIQDQFGKVSFPPGNRTSWEGLVRKSKEYWHWLRNVTQAPVWDYSKCVAAFPSQPGPEGVAKLQNMFEGINLPNEGPMHFVKYIDNPTPVDASTQDRLQEMLAHRKKLCIFDDRYQQSKVMHFMGDNDSGARLLVHFYAFLFFEDWHQDLWTKRYVRDHLRYVDEIQCAAAKIVNAVRETAKSNGETSGLYDSMHIRRGDFQYEQTRIEAEEIYDNIKDVLQENTTLFIATDEKNKTFFQPLNDHYKVYFLDDFLHLVPKLNKNYYGMLDQRIASRGNTFIGAYFSTFTGYINRMRGYHAQKDKLPGWEKGKIKSYYYVEKRHKEELIKYYPLKGPLWGREFPIGWRDIDHDLDAGQIVA